MSIPKSAVDKSADMALAAAKAMMVSTSTTKEEVERYISASLENGWTTDFEIIAPTAAKTSFVYYEFTVGNGSGTPHEASIVQVIPVLGRAVTPPKKPVTTTYTATPHQRQAVRGRPGQDAHRV